MFKKQNYKTTSVMMVLGAISMISAYSIIFILPNLIDYSSNKEEYEFLLISHGSTTIIVALIFILIDVP